MEYYVYDELYHHGVKGQKWGVRRYQYKDGSLTPLGEKHIQNNQAKGLNKVAKKAGEHATYAVNKVRTVVTGQKYVDTYLKAGTQFSRVQTSGDFEDFPFYATYKNHDIKEYIGLFGSNLKGRAANDAKRAEKLAKKTGDENDIANAKALREKADNMKIYQLKLETTKKLKIPSEDNASDITHKLMKKDPEFRKNLEASIEDTGNNMHLATHKMLIKQAKTALAKDPDKMSASDKKAVYRAFNLSLVFHNDKEVAAQNKFYGELKKKGYDALLDINDKSYSSYHAKQPTIVFNRDSIRKQSVNELDPDYINKLYKRYNTERWIKTSISTAKVPAQYLKQSVKQCQDYMNRKEDSYLNG